MSSEQETTNTHETIGTENHISFIDMNCIPESESKCQSNWEKNGKTATSSGAYDQTASG